MDLLREKLKAQGYARLMDGGGDGGGGGDSGADYGGYSGGGYEAGYGGYDTSTSDGGFNAAVDSQAANVDLGLGPVGDFTGSVDYGGGGTYSGDLSPLAPTTITSLGTVPEVQAGTFAPDVGGYNWGGLIGRVAGTLALGPIGGLVGYGIGTLAQRGYFGELTPQEQSAISAYDQMTAGGGSVEGFQNYLQQLQAGTTTLPTGTGGTMATGEIPSYLQTSPEESALRMAQLDLINQQRSIATEMLRRQNLLEPLLLQQQGFEQVLDAQGNVIGYRQAAVPGQEQMDEINNLLRTRTLAALRGELPVDPALERSLQENRLTLHEALRRQLGSGYETSTPGIEALADYDKRAEELRMQARFGQLQAGEGMRLASAGFENQLQQQRFGNVVGLSQLGQVPAGIYGQALSAYDPMSKNLLQSRALLSDYFTRTGATAASLEAARIAAAADRYRADVAAGGDESAAWGSALGTLGTAFIGSPVGQSALSSIGGFLGGIFG